MTHALCVCGHDVRSHTMWGWHRCEAPGCGCSAYNTNRSATPERRPDTKRERELLDDYTPGAPGPCAHPSWNGYGGCNACGEYVGEDRTGAPRPGSQPPSTDWMAEAAKWHAKCMTYTEQIEAMRPVVEAVVAWAEAIPQENRFPGKQPPWVQQSPGSKRWDVMQAAIRDYQETSDA